MKLLDRYILRQYLVNFVILLAVLLLLIVMTTFIVNADEFVEAGRRQVQQGRFAWVVTGTLYALWDFYYPNLFLLYVMMGGLAAVGALGFTFLALGRTGELAAIVIGGWSMHRAALPALAAGCVLCLLALPIQEWVIPPLAGKLARGPSEAREESISTFAVYYTPDGQGNLFSAARFDPRRGALENLSILGRDAQGQVERRITAPEAHWNAPRQGWELTGGVIRQRDPGGDAGEMFARQRPLDFVASDLTPTALLVRQASIYPRLLGIPELLRLAANPSAQRQNLWRVIHGRFAMVALHCLLLVAALPFFLSREPVLPTRQALKATALVMGCWCAGLLMIQAGVGSLNAATCAWLPVAVLLPVAAWMGLRVKT